MDTSVEDKDMTYDPEIEKLLPWYAKGLLESHESEQVEAYLAANPEMRMQLDLIAEEDTAIAEQHAALGAPMPGGLDRLMAGIDALEAKEAPVQAAAKGVWQRIQDVLGNFASPGMQLAAAAAAVVIVAQGVIIGALVQTGPGAPAAPSASGQFKTASGPEQAAQQSGARFLIAFKSEASMADVAKLLKSQHAVIVAGPKAGGFFELMVPNTKLPEGGAEVVLKALKDSTDLVKFASVSQ
ncbi:hypothetical protein [Cohaesibacter intestini]|uniref:hypothetical protein n=1 Tax=Cohaesibacter intestini TaxID=2211145 RepID=UPI000DEB8BB6|nr:hypothetical protein [Cohaesibacter intestini]